MFNQINEDLTNKMKSRDKFEVSVLRMLKSEIKNAEINKKESLTDEEVLALIKKQVKVRKESKVEFEAYNRTDLADNLGKEIEILNKYLPEELTETEILKIVEETISELNASSIKDMGAIIKAVSLKCGATADMKTVSSLVKEKLTN